MASIDPAPSPLRVEICSMIDKSIQVKKAVLSNIVPDIEAAARLILASIHKGKKIFFFGNGGSASDAQHLAAEFVGRYQRERRALPAIALTTDSSIMTALTNDYSFQTVFSRQLEALGQAGDIAFGISTSGNSENVVHGLRRAKELGISTIALTGKDGGLLPSLADVCITVPSPTTSRIQESHIMIGHILCELIDNHLDDLSLK